MRTARPNLLAVPSTGSCRKSRNRRSSTVAAPLRIVNLNNVSAEQRGAYLSVLAVAGIILVLLLLHILFMREQVRKDLRRRGLRPLRMRWHPYTYWGEPYC